MPVYHGSAQPGSPAAKLSANLPEHVQISLYEFAGKVKEGLLAFSVAVGPQVLKDLMEAEVKEIVGPRGKHNLQRTAVRHGTENGSVVLGGRRVKVKRPRIRTVDNKREIRIEAYDVFQGGNPDGRKTWPASTAV